MRIAVAPGPPQAVQSGMPKLSRVAPELPASNVAESCRYYETKLGFETVITMPDGDYAIVERFGTREK